MFDLLVMPLSKAKALIPLWNDAQISTRIIAFVCFVLWVVAMCFIGALVDAYKEKKKHVWYWIAWILIVPTTLTLFVSIFSGMPNVNSARDKNIGAISNVSCYYKMRHLRKIYHTLPYKPYKKKIYKTGSITKANHYKYESKHMLTKPKAAKEYAEMKRAYRKPVDSAGNNGNTRNGTRSLSPKAPRWWNYIWN